MQNNQPTATDAAKPNRTTDAKSAVPWLRFLALALVLLVIAMWVGWRFAADQIQTRINNQLAALELGTTKIDRVSISTAGVQANDVRFFRTPNDDEPWLTLDRLSIEHPLRELIAGANNYDQVELLGATVRLDPASLSFASDDASIGLDLSSLALPADKVQITNAQVVLIKPAVGHEKDRSLQPTDRTESAPREQAIAVKGIQLTLTRVNEQGDIKIFGAVGQLLGGQWDVTGQVSPTQKTATLDVASSDAGVTNRDWQQLPLIPDNLDRYVTADGQLSIAARVRKTADSDWSVTGSGNVKQATINLPTFNLPIEVQGADFQLVDGQLNVQNVVANLNDEAKILASSQLSLQGFPLQIQFDAKYETLTASTLRLLVSPLPRQLSFWASGTAMGSVTVEQSTRTQINVSARGESPGGAYGDIQAESMSADVSIEQLTFDGNQSFESVGGQVDATAMAPLQNVDGIFETFELNRLQQQLGITGDGAGQMRLQLPLATADQLQTWSLTVDAQAPTAQISGQPLRKVQTKVLMRDGQLVFDPFVASIENQVPAANKTASGPPSQPIDLLDNLNASIRWPLVDDGQKQGSIEIQSQRVPTEWLVGFYQTQIATMGSTAGDTAPVDRWLDQLQGNANVTAKLTIPSDQPDDWTHWIANARLRESTIGLRQTTLDQLTADLRLNKGAVTLDQLTSKLTDPRVKGGVVNARAQFDLQNQQASVEQATLKTADGAEILATGQWSADAPAATGSATWKKISVEWLAELAGVSTGGVTGQTDGQLQARTLEPSARDAQDATADPNPVDVSGRVVIRDFSAASIGVKSLGFKIRTRDNDIELDQFKTIGRDEPWDVTASLGISAPHEFSIGGKFTKDRLSQILARRSLAAADANIADITGILAGHFSAAGELQPFNIRTNGHVKIEQPTYDGLALSTIEVDWKHFGDDWDKSRLLVDLFGGTIELAEVSQTPQRIRLAVDNIDARQASSIFELPVQVTGTLAGDASLNDWSLRETRLADLDLKASSILIGDTEYGDFHLHADYRRGALTYGIDGALLDGKLVGTGETKIPDHDLQKVRFPLELRLTGAVLDRLHRRSVSLRWLRPLTGQLIAKANLEFAIDQPATGSGRISAVAAQWDRHTVSKNASIRFRLNENNIVFDNVQADLKRGTISARAVIPTGSNAAGSYEVNLRNVDLERLAETAGGEFEARGLLDARISGQLGRRVSGQGTVGVHRATVAGVAGRSLNLPIQFRIDPRTGSGRLELRRSTFRLFDGNASGKASVNFGNGLSVDADVKLTNVDTGKMLASVAEVAQASQGKLTGRIKLKGRGVRSVRDLTGSFRGELDRVSAFTLPIFEDIARVLAGGAFRSSDYESDEVIFLLDKGRIEVRKLNFSSSLVKIAVTGYAYLDGRLDLAAAARVDRLQQPTLIDSIAGSPLARLRGSPVAFFAQAAEFLSERIAFFKIVGTFARPQVRLDTGQQLREEMIRYFLRGSQILPDARNPSN